MNVLIAGAGAREHAIAWKLRQSPLVGAIYTAPGNGGTAMLGRNLRIAPHDVAALVAAATEHDVGLVIASTDASVAAGLADACAEAGIRCFGPTQAAGRLESSKSFAKSLMVELGIPTAAARIFDDPDEAEAYARAANRPLVIKVDGLAAGKGVTVARDPETAVEAVAAAMRQRVFGDAGGRTLIEEFLEGVEVSYHVVCDGERFVPLVPACDYKRVGDHDEGPNTGGMGAYSPPAFVTPELAAEIESRIILPVVRAMARRGTPYRGVLYAGLMIVGGHPFVIEFNARLGDPEAQVILPRLEGDLAELMLTACEGRLSAVAIGWRREATVGVVLASGGYPGEHQVGLPIRGLETLPPDVLVFHAGTRLRESLSFPPVLETAGGRVLTVVGMGATIAEARDAAYRVVPGIIFANRHYRTDIAMREIEAQGLQARVRVTAPPLRTERETVIEPLVPVAPNPLEAATGKRKRRRRRRSRGGSTPRSGESAA